MASELLQVAGGLGLFLLGMSIMTDGLRGLAGRILHKTLAHITRSPASGAASGAAITALLQSSSATTVAAVGFVSAGLLSFPQALGVVFGANVGTTVTGWLVALFGLKFSIGGIAYPLVLAGALLRLFGRNKLAAAGTALSGFGLLFVGIALLQAGLEGYQGIVTPDTFPADTTAGRLLLVAIGIGITLLTQSSSAGVATALTAVFTGTITFPQAAALVIGMDVGTTVTAALATLGGSVETRRTGYSHVIYNLLTGLGAFLLLTPYTITWESLAPGALQAHAELALVGFHTLFNLLGVLLILPFAPLFARMMMRLVKDVPPNERQLAPLLLKEPAVALDAAGRLATKLTRDSFRLVAQQLGPPEGPSEEDTSAAAFRRVRTGVDQVQNYVDSIHLLPEQAKDWARLNALIHLLDHLQRLLDRCEEEVERVRILRQVDFLRKTAELASEVLTQVLDRIDHQDWQSAAELSTSHASGFDSEAELLRAGIMGDMASGQLEIPEGTAQLEAVRWLRRGLAHSARITAYLARLNT